MTLNKFSAGAACGCAVLAAAAADIPVCTYDELSNRAVSKTTNIKRALEPGEIKYLAENQLTLCMIGDSVTWAEDGDHFRGELLKLIPELAFAGTHTAVLGYSHAGEGGDSTTRVLNRLNDPARVPDAPYYHVLIGINDSGSAKLDSESAEVAAGTAGRIFKIVEELLKKPATRKVFLASILPSPFDSNGNSTVRERTGSLVNTLLRKELANRFPGSSVVWVEYEKPLRENLAEWKKIENLRGAHPTAQGYKTLAAIAAPVLKKNMQPEPLAKDAVPDVEVVNLYLNSENISKPLYPGWYTLSMELDNCKEADFTLFSLCNDAKSRFEKSYHVAGKAGSRVEVNFFTGYQNYGYTLAPFKLDFSVGKVKNIQIEKMRPLERASVYTPDRTVDSISPIAAGEKLEAGR